MHVDLFFVRILSSTLATLPAPFSLSELSGDAPPEDNTIDTKKQYRTIMNQGEFSKIYT